jgi:anti-anti-sigma factor
MDVSSRILRITPDHCPFCGNVVIVGPASHPARDAPCPHCGKLLWFVRKTVGDVVILTFLPGLMSGGESVLRVDEVSLALGDSTRIVLNLAQLPFISSVFLGMLVALRKRVLAANGVLRLCGLQRQTMAAFTITKLDTLFDLFIDEKGALENL